MDGAWLHDPASVAPRISLLKVPEPKTAKNRLHLDLRVSVTGTAEQTLARVTDEVARLCAAGPAVLHEFAGHHVVRRTRKAMNSASRDHRTRQK